MYDALNEQSDQICWYCKTNDCHIKAPEVMKVFKSYAKIHDEMIQKLLTLESIILNASLISKISHPLQTS